MIKITELKILQTVIENLGQRLAAANHGVIFLNQMLPYLPVSLKVLEAGMDEMVDDALVCKIVEGGCKAYRFTELVDTTEQVFPTGVCFYSGDKFSPEVGKILCDRVQRALEKELEGLAVNEAWPAEAVWQHELLYITAKVQRALGVTEIAGSSRMTLKQVKEKLQQLKQDGYCQEVIKAGSLPEYIFPEITYEPDLYRAHDRFIRSYPSSLQEEKEVRIIKVLTYLIGIVFGGFLLNFIVRIPFPLLILLITASCVVTALKLWFSKEIREPEPIMY